MNKIKTQKGITLVALIITIVVLLIIAVVAIGAVRDSSIIGHAQNAAKDYNSAKDAEGSMLSEYEDVIAQYANNNGESSGDTPIDSLKKYVLGSKLKGRSILEILDIDNMQFYDDSATSDIDESEIRWAGVNRNYLAYENNIIADILYIIQDNNLYSFQVFEKDGDLITDSNFGVNLEDTLEEGTKVGKYVKYDNKKWIVLYDDDINGLQMISEEVWSNTDGSKIILGCYENEYNSMCDPTIDETKVQEFDGIEGISSLEKSMYSYNNAVTTLNNKCRELVTQKQGITKAVRSVGSNPVDPSKENLVKYSTDRLATLPINHPTYAPGILNGVGYSTDNNYKYDLSRMHLLNIAETGEDTYWLASRMCHYDEHKDDGIDSFRFSILTCDSEGLYKEWLVTTTSTENLKDLSGDYSSEYVRPVIILEPGVLDNEGVTGLGTSESPWDLDSLEIN